jgi:lysozyme
MKTSEAGYNLIKKWETCVLTPYQDSVGVWTIGYGHTNTATQAMQPITVAQAIVLLKEDIRIVEAFINLWIPGLRQCQFDALVALLFNIGASAKFRKTNLYNLLKKTPDDKHIADEWIEFRNAGGKYLRGLMRRRFDELSLYYSW